LAAEEPIRRRLPRGGELRCHRRFPASGLRTSCRHAGRRRPGAEDGRVDAESVRPQTQKCRDLPTSRRSQNGTSTCSFRQG
jgi:hypothetical protein